MKRSLPFALFAAGLSLSVTLASDDAVEPHGTAGLPKFTCVLDRPMEDCAVVSGKDGVVLRIASESGIGGAGHPLR